jgi:hypothetical protein
MKQTILTFITRVEPGRLHELNRLLNEIGEDVMHNPHLPFTSLKLLHFASLVLHQDPSYGSYLVFENNFDGPLDDYLEDLYRHAAEALHRIYSCCEDFPASNAADRAQILSYLRSHVVRPNAYHIGNPGRPVERIRREDNLRDNIEDFLDDLVREGQAGSSLDSIRRRVQAFVQGQSALAWAFDVQPRQTAMEQLIPWLKVAIVALIALLLLPLLIPLFIGWVIVLRSKEKSDPVASDLGDKTHVRELVEREDRTHIVQNHMASIALVKPGFFRRATLRSVLWLINLLARTQNKGKLGGIPSIHFAHWCLIDNGRRLLFLSNFDGSWENYLDDFIDKASPGLTSIWSNTENFPRTRFLVLEGARDGARFKDMARDSQTYTNVWYSAYPDLTVQTVDNNSAIREDLFTSLDETSKRDWLLRF